MTKSFEVISSVFDKPGRDGDFSLMSRQAENEKTLFIFNDNEEQFRAFVRGDSSGFSKGGGNAAIRPLRGLKPPRAAGVPTGIHGDGYSRLDEATKKVINESIAVIQELLNSGDYERMIFSKDKSSPTLGTGLFFVAEDVKKYIYDALMSMMPS
jgi:hypothetical protein